MANPFFADCLGDFDPPAVDAAEAEKERAAYPDALAPFWGLVLLAKCLAPVAAQVGESYETFAVADGQGSSSASKAAAAADDDDDDDALLPYGAFAAITKAAATTQEPGEPAWPHGPALHGPPEPAAAPPPLAPSLAGLDEEDEAVLAPYRSPRGMCVSDVNRGDAAAATWIFLRRIAAATFRGLSTAARAAPGTSRSWRSTTSSSMTPRRSSPRARRIRRKMAAGSL